MLEIIVPGSDRYLEVLRAVAGRATRIAGFSFDGIEDFSLVVDESAVLLLQAKPASLRLRFVALGDDRTVTAELAIEGSDGNWPPPGLETGTRWQVIQALCESVWLLEDARGIGLSQSIR